MVNTGLCCDPQGRFHLKVRVISASDGAASRATRRRSMPSRPPRSEPTRVRIPTPLRSYTGDRLEVESCGDTLAELLVGLDRRHPSIRFRMIDERDSIRRHMRIFVNGDQVRRLDEALDGSEEVIILRR